jgi:hypothetical protein
MRWQLAPVPQKGDRQAWSWFALWPVYAGGEGRWLRWVTVMYECEGSSTYDGITWRPLFFLD